MLFLKHNTKQTQVAGSNFFNY